MTDVTWEIVDTYNIQPKGMDGLSKSIVPNGTASVGASSDRWNTAFVHDVDASGDVNVVGNINTDSDVVVDGKVEANKNMNADGIALIVYGDNSSSDAQVLIKASPSVSRLFLACAAMSSTGSDARTILAQENDEAAIPVASFKQSDEDAPFVDFEGTTAADASANISTGNGNGDVVGPRAKNTAEMGWTFDSMVKIRITPASPGEPYYVWVPGFVPDED
jgi:hypothetical protein